MDLTPIQTVRDFYNSLAPGRRAELMEILDPHVEVELPEGFPGGGGVFRGLKAYIEDFVYVFYGMFDVELSVDEYLEAGEKVVAVGRMKGIAVSTNIPVDASFIHVWTVRQGHLLRGRMFGDTAVLCAAARVECHVPH
ncbi:MAG TPA: nuclear transport factor 2 family protein [Planctomycetota bacterium]|nr:nuclear transport factor 2 family protein [Planctomycetota bacterium]